MVQRATGKGATSTKVRRLAIYGCGGFGRELVRPARAYLAAHGGGDIVFATDNRDFVGGTLFDIAIISSTDLRPSDHYVLAIANWEARKDVSARVAAAPLSLIAPSTLIGPDVQIGSGAVLCDHVTLTASVRIGAFFQGNIYSYVAHDCVIGDFVTFAPKVCCNGNVHIGDGAYIGTGAILRQGKPGAPLMIGAGAVIGMGAVVTKDVPPGVTVVGNPARVMN